MATNNAIGTGAVILTASADQMLAGLDKAGTQAAQKAGKIGDKVSKAAGAGGKDKGLFGDILGGVVGGAAFAGVKHLFDGLSNAAGGAFDRLTEAGHGSTLSIGDSFSRLLAVGDKLFGKLFDAAAPALGRLADVAADLFDRFGPVIEDAAKSFSDLLFVAVELGNEFAGLLGSFGRFGDLGLTVARAVGKAFAYLWDTVKAGAGVIAYVAGLVVKAAGSMVAALGEAVRTLQSLADQLPESVRPTWIGRAGEAVAGFGNRVNAIGQDLKEWGRNAVAGFGQSAGAVDAWFDRVAERLDAQRAKAMGFVKAMADAGLGPKLAGVIDKGSQADYSIAQRFRLQDRSAQNDPTKIVEEQKKTNQKLDRIIWRAENPMQGRIIITPY